MFQLPFLGDQPNPAAGASPGDNPSQTGGKWADFLGKPENRSMLLQTGISLLTGNGSGNFGSELGSALGQGMQAKDTVIQNEQAQAAQAAENQLNQEKLKIQQQGVGIDQQQLAISQQNADTARISANKSGATGGVEDRANRASWLKFVTGKLSEAATMGEEAPSIDQLAQEWQAIGGVLPASISGVPSPTATSPAPLTKVINGTTYVQENGQWMVEE